MPCEMAGKAEIVASRVGEGADLKNGGVALRLCELRVSGFLAVNAGN